MNPLHEIVIASSIITLVSQTVYLVMVNQDYVEKMRKKLKDMHKDLRTMEPNSKEYKSLLNEQFKLNMQMSKHTMKPSLITIIPYFIVFSMLRTRYEGLEVLQLPFTFLSKTYLGWLGTFMLTSLILTLTIQTSYKKYRKIKKGDSNANSTKEENEKSS